MAKVSGGLLFAALFFSAPLPAQIGPEFMSHQPESYSEQCPCSVAGSRAPVHRCVLRTRWRDDHFLEQQFQDSAWPARRDDELSDQLSR